MSEDVRTTTGRLVEGVQVINLDARPERWALFLQGASNWERAFGHSVLRFAAVSGLELKGFNQLPWFRKRIKERRRKSWAGKAGCVLSHRNAIQHAQEQSWDNVLILEDDALLAPEMVQAWTEGLDALVAGLPKDWSAVYFYTANPITPCRVVAEMNGIRLIETMGAYGTVAYLVNGRIFKPLLDKLPTEKNIWPWVARYKAIDLWFSRSLRSYGKVYAFAPSLAGHQVGPSDITVTPESEWTFDGEMKGLVYTNNPILFVIKKRGRSIEWFYQEFISYLRMQLKKVRGL